MTKTIKNPLIWTETNVETIRPPGLKADEKVKHPTIKGLAIRFRNIVDDDGKVIAIGTGVYTHYFTLDGIAKKTNIDKVGAVTLQFAIGENHRYNAGLSSGTDPVSPVVLKRQAKAGLSVSFGNAVTTYLAHLDAQVAAGQLTADYVKNPTRHLKVRCASLHAYPIKQLDRATVRTHLEQIGEELGEGPRDAALGALTAFYTWAIGTKGYCDVSPVLYMDRLPRVENTNVPVVTELALIWKTAKKLAVATGRASVARRYGAILQLLVLTAARKSQIAKLRWNEVYLDGSAHIKQPHILLEGKLSKSEARRAQKAGIEITESRSKNRRRFAIILSRQAVAVLRKLEPVEGEPVPTFVFGNNWSNGKDAIKVEGAFSAWGQADRLIKDYLGDSKGWTHHDFRRSWSTLGRDELKITGEVLNFSINHVPQSQQGTEKHYNYAKMADERLAAAQKWADYIESTARDQDRPQLKIVA